MNAVGRQIICLTRDVFREVARERANWVCAPIALLAVLSGWAMRDFNFGEYEGTFLIHTATTLQLLIAGVWVIATVAVGWHRFVEQGRAEVVLSRPILPIFVVVGRLGGVLIWACGFLTISTGVIATAMMVSGHANSARGLLLIGWGQGWILVTLGAISAAVSCIGRNVVFALLCTLLMWLAGELRVGWGQSGGFAQWVTWMVPQFGILDFRNAEAGGWRQSLVPVLSAVFYATAFLTLAAFSARRRVR